MIKKVFPILALSMFSSTLGIGIVMPLLPLYISEMGATGVWLGVIVSSYAISNAISVPVAGRLSDVKGRKIFLTTGLFAYSLISLGYIYAPTVYLLAAVRFIHGIAGAMTIPVAVAYLGDLSPRNEEGRWMGFANAAFFSGFGFGPLMGGLVTENFGMNTAFLVMAGLNMLSFIIVLLFLPKVQERKKGEEFNLSLKDMSASSVVRGLLTVRMGEALGRGSMFTFLPIFGVAIGLSVSLIGVLVSVNTLSITLFSPVAGLIADRFSRRTLAVLGISGFGILILLIPFAGNFWQMLIILLAQGLVVSVYVSATNAIGVYEGRKFGMGSVMSVMFLGMGVGMGVGPIIAGWIEGLIGLKAVFYWGGLICLVGTALFFLFTRSYRDRREPAEL
jgi:DHA1 family multidrug resistance protein-like MFS transporter